jgi:hypothetical protein
MKRYKLELKTFGDRLVDVLVEDSQGDWVNIGELEQCKECLSVRVKDSAYHCES